MTHYLVGPPEPADWQLSFEQFHAALLSEWPTATVSPVGAPRTEASAEFEIPLAGDEVTGRLLAGGQAIVIEADLEPSAQVAAWYRQHLVPPENALVFTDEHYETAVPLEPGTDAQTLASAYLGAD